MWSEGELTGGAWELYTTGQLRAAATSVKDGEGVRLDIVVKLVLGAIHYKYTYLA